MSENYIDTIANRIYAKVGGKGRPNDTDAPLYRMYAVLALAKGMHVTAEDVHDGWSAWCAAVTPNHQSLRPFAELTDYVQGLDKRYRDAIRNVAVELYQERGEPQ